MYAYSSQFVKHSGFRHRLTLLCQLQSHVNTIFRTLFIPLALEKHKIQILGTPFLHLCCSVAPATILADENIPFLIDTNKFSFILCMIKIFVMSHNVFTPSPVTNCHAFFESSLPWSMTYFMDGP